MAKSKNMVEFKKSEEQRRIEAKREILDKYSTSEDLFDALKDEINTLSQDESYHDFTVGDDYNFGVEYDIELLLEVISDLRWFTRLNHSDDNKTIKSYNLDYVRDYI